MIGLFIGVKCNEEDRALLCSLCVDTTDGCQGDCAFDNELNRCYKRGNFMLNIDNEFHLIKVSNTHDQTLCFMLCIFHQSKS